MSFRFHHIHIVCEDLERMIGFFTESLGAALRERLKFGSADGATLELDRVTVNLRTVREDEQRDPAAPAGLGYDHIGLAVDDVDAAYERLSAQGFEFFIPPKDIPGLRIAFFRGPEKLTVELVQEK